MIQNSKQTQKKMINGLIIYVYNVPFSMDCLHVTAHSTNGKL